MIECNKNILEQNPCKINSYVFSRSFLEKTFFDNFTKNIEFIVKKDASEKDIDEFISITKSFLKFNDLKEFISLEFEYQANELSKYYFIEGKEYFFYFKQFINILVKLNEDWIIERIIKSFTLKIDKLLLFIKEMFKVKQKLYYEKLIFNSMTNDAWSFNQFTKFINIINKDYKYLISKFIDYKLHYNLQCFIKDLFKANTTHFFLDELASYLLEKCDSDLYCECIFTMCLNTPSIYEKFIPLNNKDVRVKYECFLLTQYVYDFRIITEYLQFLASKCNDAFMDFEEKYINSCNDAHTIYTYAMTFSLSNKKLIIIKLAQLKEEYYLIQFCDKFPQYKSYLFLI
jgi:hypothetical protein